MFGKAIRKIAAAVGMGEQVDPALRFSDPLAGKTGWGPAHPGGTNFRTRRLVMRRNDVAAFVPTFGLHMFCWIFILIGLFTLGLAVYALLYADEEAGWAPFVMAMTMAVICGGAGIAMRRTLFGPIVFDRVAGIYRTQAEHSGPIEPDAAGSEPPIALGRIHALQVIYERMDQTEGSLSYELNLVLDNAERLNVIDHGKQRKLQSDAKKLAEFLDVPLWDVTDPLPAGWVPEGIAGATTPESLKPADRAFDA